MKFAKGDTRTRAQKWEMESNPAFQEIKENERRMGVVGVALVVGAIVSAAYGIGKDVVDKAEIANRSQTSTSNPFVAQTGDDAFEKGIIAAKQKASTSPTVSGPSGSGGPEM